MVVPDNTSTGATGSIAAEFVAKSAPDGYTLFLSSSSIMSANPVLNTKISYDPIRDFAPISLTATIENVLVVNPAVPAKTIAELITYAKANPDKLSYSSSGIGSTYHLSGELFAAQLPAPSCCTFPTRARPRRRWTCWPATSSCSMFDNIPSALPNIKTGKVRALGVASLKRYKDLPDVPTIAESGVPDYEVIIWTALYAPAKTPGPIIDVLNRATVAALAAPDMQERYAKLGMNAESCSARRHLLEYNKAGPCQMGQGGEGRQHQDGVAGSLLRPRRLSSRRTGHVPVNTLYIKLSPAPASLPAQGVLRGGFTLRICMSSARKSARG